MHDRSAAGQRVGGRPGRRGDDDAIGSLDVNQRPAAGNLVLDHARGFITVQYDVVQRDMVADALIAKKEFTLYQKTLLNRVTALEHFVDIGFEAIEGDVGKKAEPPEIDTEQRRVDTRQRTCRGQQGAVTTQRNHQVGLVDELL